MHWWKKQLLLTELTQMVSAEQAQRYQTLGFAVLESLQLRRSRASLRTCTSIFGVQHLCGSTGLGVIPNIRDWVLTTSRNAQSQLLWQMPPDLFWQSRSPEYRTPAPNQPAFSFEQAIPV